MTRATEQRTYTDEGSFWGRDDLVKKMRDDQKKHGVVRLRKTTKTATLGTSTSDMGEIERLKADGYEVIEMVENSQYDLSAPRDGKPGVASWILTHFSKNLGWHNRNKPCRREDVIKMLVHEYDNNEHMLAKAIEFMDAIEAKYASSTLAKVTEEPKRMAVTAADEKANTVAWQRYAAGDKRYIYKLSDTD